MICLYYERIIFIFAPPNDNDMKLIKHTSAKEGKPERMPAFFHSLQWLLRRYS